MMRKVTLAAAAVVSATLVGGCSFTGLNSYPLPLSKGAGDDAITVTVVLENATNLVPNSEVKFREVTIGSVRRIELDDWNAKLTVAIDRDAAIPADVRAQVAQKSLLGAEYLELKTDSAPDGVEQVLADGATIGLERTDRYPETEEVLSAASLLFNGGGLPQIQTIAHELNTAFSGRVPTVNSLVDRVGDTAAELHQQQDSIVASMKQMKRLSAKVNDQRRVVEQALETIPRGLRVLDENEPALAGALDSLGRLQEPMARGLGANAESFGRTLDLLAPVTRDLAEFGPDLSHVSEALTWPFIPSASGPVTHAGFINIFVNVSLSLPELVGSWFGVDTLREVYDLLEQNTPLGEATDNIDPLTDALDELGLIDRVRPGASLQDGASGTGGTSGTADPQQPTGLGGLLRSLLGGGR